MTPQAYLYVCDGDIDNPVLTHKKMDWPEKYPHWQEIPLVMARPDQQPPQFPTMLRKMWSGTEVQEWINENWK